MALSQHQLQQQAVVNKITRQVSQNSLNFTTVAPVDDYASDPRVCLTSVHFPDQKLVAKIQESLISPLREIEPNFFYYPADSLHMTIKNVRVINDPPSFDEQDIDQAHQVFSAVVPQHHRFQVYFYRLLLFPNNLALIGTTDPELDSLVLDLDKQLKLKNIPDDKQYANSQYFFINMTLTRFNTLPSPAFKSKVESLSSTLEFDPYTVDDVSLVTCNAVFRQKKILGTWSLQ